MVRRFAASELCGCHKLVYANVYGLCWSESLLAKMECAALFSPLVIQSLETSSGYGFEERRVRPWPPVECSRGTTPIQAANSRPLWKAPPLPIAAMSAV